MIDKDKNWHRQERMRAAGTIQLDGRTIWTQFFVAAYQAQAVITASHERARKDAVLLADVMLEEYIEAMTYV